MTTVGARHCQKCDVPWPSEVEDTDRSPLYSTCPLCQQATFFEKDRRALEPDEACHFAFEVYYQRRETERMERGDPPPEHWE